MVKDTCKECVSEPCGKTEKNFNPIPNWVEINGVMLQTYEIAAYGKVIYPGQYKDSEDSYTLFVWVHRINNPISISFVDLEEMNKAYEELSLKLQINRE